MVHESSEFYTRTWTQWRDDMLIRHLDFHSCYDKIRYNAESTQIFSNILAFRHDFCRARITSEAIGKRFQKLEKRYETWRFVINRADVLYDKDKNKVTASLETWEKIYKEYELGRLYSNEENEHLWDELCGIFGPASVRIARNVLITPYPQSKLTWNREVDTIADEDCESPKWPTDSEEVEEDEGLDSRDQRIRVPKDHICPYPGDTIMNPPEMRGGSSSPQTDVPEKKLKSKRFLDF